MYGNPNNCRLQHERTYRTPTLIKLQIMCCGMSNFIVQHTAIYCCIVVLITFALCTVLFIFYAVQANQFCCMFCFYRYQSTWFLTLQFTWYWTWLSFSVIPVVGSDLIEQVRLSRSSVIIFLPKTAAVVVSCILLLLRFYVCSLEIKDWSYMIQASLCFTYSFINIAGAIFMSFGQNDINIVLSTASSLI